MTTNLITVAGKNVVLNRGYKSSPDYTPPSQYKFGIDNGTPTENDTALDYAIPILDGTTNDDGSNTLTGSSGGDNSTDNTTTYKQGAGNTDVTAQNLIANNGNATKIWTISNLASAGTLITAGQPFALWLYIVDATALAKFKSSGTCLEIKLGSDSSNYYSKTFEASDLATGWNWITSNTVNVEDLTETGTVTGNIDTFIIEITTNNATDTFVAGDVVYDLLRQWQESDLLSNFVTGYPTFDEVNNKVTMRVFLASTQANGFPINADAIFNTDATPVMTDVNEFDEESKSNTDEYIFIDTNKAE